MPRYVTKSEFAERIGITRGRVSQLLKQGMPELSTGTLELRACLNWIVQNIRPSADRVHNLQAKAETVLADLDTATPSAEKARARANSPAAKRGADRLRPVRREPTKAEVLVPQERPETPGPLLPPPPTVARPTPGKTTDPFAEGALAVIRYMAERVPALAAATLVEHGGDALSAYALFRGVEFTLVAELRTVAEGLGVEAWPDPELDPDLDLPVPVVPPNWESLAALSREPVNVEAWAEHYNDAIAYASGPWIEAATHALFGLPDYYCELIRRENTAAAA